MIEKDIQQYLQAQTPLTSMLGGPQKIYSIQAPTGVTMPWVIIEPSGGPRTRISATKGEEHNSVRIGVDVGPSQWILGRNIIEMVKSYVENLRGTIGDAQDLEIVCNSVSGYPGLKGAYRYNLTCKCRFIYDWATVRPQI